MKRSKLSDFLAHYFSLYGITDAFGVPGGVILPFMYSLQEAGKIKIHLSYNEQAAAFEAIGYSQSKHAIGLAYSTRGPGFTNMTTGIAEAFSESLPVIFVTAHSGSLVGNSRRFEKNQEINSSEIAKSISKGCFVVDDADKAVSIIKKAFYIAINDRPGPVILDISSELWNEIVFFEDNDLIIKDCIKGPIPYNLIKKTLSSIISSKRPLILIGDGIRQSKSLDSFVNLSFKITMPVVSSRSSIDIGSLSNNYFGYIGSHGIRYSNHIFHKSDLIISLGNSLSFPLSDSFLKTIRNKQIIRIDCDERELSKTLPNTINIHCDISTFLDEIVKSEQIIPKFSDWLFACNTIKTKLLNQDTNEPMLRISSVLQSVSTDTTIVCDVGNNEFWTSGSYVFSKSQNRVLISKSFSMLGCSIPKSIGAFFATGHPIICITGDQGFQFNIQELEVISNNKLPIHILIINNHSSGMIKDREKKNKGKSYIHVDFESGYGQPSFSLIAKAYGIKYLTFEEYLSKLHRSNFVNKPAIIEMDVDDNVSIPTSLPKGNLMHELEPLLDDSLRKEIEKI